jgi:hypothetical protein
MPAFTARRVCHHCIQGEALSAWLNVHAQSLEELPEEAATEPASALLDPSQPLDLPLLDATVLALRAAGPDHEVCVLMDSARMRLGSKPPCSLVQGSSLLK